MRWSSSAASSGRASCRSCQASRWAKRMTAGRISTGADDAVDVMMPSMPRGVPTPSRSISAQAARASVRSISAAGVTLPRRPATT